MSIAEDEHAFIRTAPRVPKHRPRRLRAVLALFLVQYTMVAIVVSLTVAGTLRYLVTPQIVTKFELIGAALTR